MLAFILQLKPILFLFSMEIKHLLSINTHFQRTRCQLVFFHKLKKDDLAQRSFKAKWSFSISFSALPQVEDYQLPRYLQLSVISVCQLLVFVLLKWDGLRQKFKRFLITYKIGATDSKCVYLGKMVTSNYLEYLFLISLPRNAGHTAFVCIWSKVSWHPVSIRPEKKVALSEELYFSTFCKKPSSLIKNKGFLLLPLRNWLHCRFISWFQRIPI